jgi:hypothetical protein
MWFIYTVELYSATKKNKIVSFAGKWMEMEIIMSKEISQTQKDKYHVFSHMGNLCIFFKVAEGNYFEESVSKRKVGDKCAGGEHDQSTQYPS